MKYIKMLDDFNEDREKLHFDIKQEKRCYLCKHKAMLKQLSEKRKLRISIGEPEITISAKTGDIRLIKYREKDVA